MFYIDGGAVGYFTESGPPTDAGIVDYMPLRSRSHHAMGVALRETGFAECHYETGGKRVSFRVVDAPEYGRLQVDKVRVHE